MLQGLQVPQARQVLPVAWVRLALPVLGVVLVASVAVALVAGVTAFVQPGGSIRDAEAVAAAEAAGAAMVMTGIRHFRH